MLKYDVFDDYGKPVSEHWDDKKRKHWHDTVCYANYLLIAMFVQLCVKHWDDKKEALG
ncbi:MAG: hypothetical protein LBJ80_05560 [Rickettsiales bacterium]|jgi:hypothetical protein|nr:hypothetical protein [Rickettsiales bacterium]